MGTVNDWWLLVIAGWGLVCAWAAIEGFKG